MSGKPKQKTAAGTGAFAVRPFSAIKGMAVEPRPVQRPPSEPAPPKQERSQVEDDLLFLTEMAGVTRIHPRSPLHSQSRTGTVRQRPPEPPDEPDDSGMFLDALKALKLDKKFTEEAAGGDAPPPRRTVSRMRQLRRGTIRLDLEIDLHGLTRDEGLDALGAFVAAAARRGQQAVLVITGKGTHSSGEPVLQGAVRSWLQEAGREWVAESVPAPPEMGGDGAIVVFLKGMTRQG